MAEQTPRQLDAAQLLSSLKFKEGAALAGRRRKVQVNWGFEFYQETLRVLSARKHGGDAGGSGGVESTAPNKSGGGKAEVCQWTLGELCDR
jgi:hypothetical protein